MDNIYREEKAPRLLAISEEQHFLLPYLNDIFAGWDISIISELQEKDILCPTYDLVVYLYESLDAEDAFKINVEGLRKTLHILTPSPPRAIVYMSTEEVYGNIEASDISEEAHLLAAGTYAKSKALAEKEIIEWGEKTGSIITILRPALIFGRGMSGWPSKMFTRVISGNYIHIRGNDSRLSLVMADDVMKAALSLYETGGIYNVADGHNPLLADLSQAMSMNCGHNKRPIYLPDKWARIITRILHAIGLPTESLKEALNPDRNRTRTLSSKKLQSRGFKFYDTLKVLSRSEPSYPYRDT